MRSEPSIAIVQPEQAGSSFNKNVHGARGLFAFLVFLFHVVNSGLATSPVLQVPIIDFLARTSEYGVELFFCISGYVISGTLRRARSPVTFLEDRAIRVYPVLTCSILTIVGLGLTTGVRGYANVHLSALVWTLPVNLLALPGVLPLANIHPAAWSLSYELFFYAYCAISWTLRRPLGRMLPWLAVPVGFVAVIFYPRAIFFAAGALVAQGWPQQSSMRQMTQHPMLFIVLMLLTWRLIQVLSLPQHMMSMTLIDWAFNARLPLAILAFVFATTAFAGIVAGHGGLAKFLRTRPLQYLGTISYSFYLWGPIIMSGTKTLLVRSDAVSAVGDGAQLLFFAAALPPSLIVAHISERLLERRLALRLRRQLHHPMPRHPPAANGEVSRVNHLMQRDVPSQ